MDFGEWAHVNLLGERGVGVYRGKRQRREETVERLGKRGLDCRHGSAAHITGAHAAVLSLHEMQ